MKEGKRIGTATGQITLLPEAMIHHIQSFLTGKEAARTSLLSKPWHSAWLTRPALEFDQSDFHINGDPKLDKIEFEKFATKTLQRYQQLNLKIESFRLHTIRSGRGISALAKKLIVQAITRIGATDLNLKLPYRCRLMSRRLKLPELCRIRRLCLNMMVVEDSFFSELSSRYPCLKDLSLVGCHGYKRIRTASTSLEYISFAEQDKAMVAKFDVPNIRKFSYSGSIIPSVSIKAAAAEASREWESDVSVTFRRRCRQTFPWWDSWSLSLSLEKLLTNLRTSRINLSLNGDFAAGFHHEGKIVPVVVENLTIDEAHILSGNGDLIESLLRVCRPKFITYYSKKEIDLLCTYNLTRILQRHYRNRTFMEVVGVEIYKENHIRKIQSETKYWEE
ncbi:hypothetical protein C2S53_004251 [Perilla frutescens var. hirtella]|uniref:F-box domain-containing protein n=1 Tax=Perilla frutescens var. hirtella TaxID=608512 RepID=A0AAD4IPA3_PERFH|nr:hypothetical protein C2S53_004251 [Perilla frutescens var. hirtella]